MFLLYGFLRWWITYKNVCKFFWAFIIEHSWNIRRWSVWIIKLILIQNPNKCDRNMTHTDTFIVWILPNKQHKTPEPLFSNATRTQFCFYCDKMKKVPTTRALFASRRVFVWMKKKKWLETWFLLTLMFIHAHAPQHQTLRKPYQKHVEAINAYYLSMISSTDLIFSLFLVRCLCYTHFFHSLRSLIVLYY